MRISVALCTYKGERFVDEQLASIAAQTRPPDEVVVRDDGSTDGTVERVRAFAAASPFPVDVGVNDRRLGARANFGVAIAACTGDVIALADQDDVWYPAKLERMAEAFAGPRAPGLVFSDADVVDESSAPTGRTCWQSFAIDDAQVRDLGGPRALSTLIVRQRRYGGTVTGATMAFRATLRPLVLPIPEPDPGRWSLVHDAWIALLVAAAGPVQPLAEPLMAYRRHAAQAAGLPPSDWRPAPGALDSLRGSSRYAGTGAGKDEEIGWLEAVVGRLGAAGDGFVDPGVVEELNVRLTHLRVRHGLPRSRPARLPTVVRELASGRYHRYSSGLRSVARDLS